MNNKNILEIYYNFLKKNNNILEAAQLTYKIYLEDGNYKTFQDFLSLLTNIIKENTPIKPYYVTLFDNLVNFQGDAIAYLKSENLTINFLRINLENYLRFFNPEIYIHNKEEYKKLLKIITEYSNYLNEKKKNSKSSEIYNAYLEEMHKGNDIKVIIESLAKKLNISNDECLNALLLHIDKLKIGPLEKIFNRLINSIYINVNYPLKREIYKSNITPSYLMEQLYNFLMLYRPDILNDNNLLSYLNIAIKEYNEYYQNKKEKEQKNNEKTQKSIQLINDFINSGYSVERFCLGKKITISDFRNYARVIKTLEHDLYEQLQNCIIEIYNPKNYQNVIFELLEMIKSNDCNFKFLDVFFKTIYGPKELISIASLFLSIEDIKLLKKYIPTNNKELAFFKYDYDISLLAKTRYTFNINGEMIEASDEIKNKVLEEMQEKYIPFDSKFYTELLRRRCIEMQTKKEKR